MYLYDNKIILRTALLLNVCYQTILDKKKLYFQLKLYVITPTVVCFTEVRIFNCFLCPHFCKTHNFVKVEGAYYFGLVPPSVRPSITSLRLGSEIS